MGYKYAVQTKLLDGEWKTTNKYSHLVLAKIAKNYDWFLDFVVRTFVYPLVTSDTLYYYRVVRFK